nr:trigger factor [uncultured Anaerobutyricum sp.]
MKKFATVALAFVLSMSMLTGCGSSKKAAEATTEVKEDTVDYGKGLNDDGTLEGVKATDYVTVCKYDSLKIAKKDVEVSDSDVQSQIDSILANYKKQVTDRKVKKGDVVNIDYKGTIDGKEFDGGSATGANLEIGSGTFIDGFEDQLIGKTPGETVQVKTTFPKDYNVTDLAGKDVVFETKINYIEEEQKLTDEFVKENLSSIHGYSTVKEMKKAIKDELYTSKKGDYIWNYMIEKSKFNEIPDDLINDRIDVLVDGLKSQLKSSDYSLKDYLSAYGIEDEAALRDQYKSSCESTVKVFLIADVIAAEKKIAVTDDDIKEYFNTDSTAQYEKQYGKAYINRIVLNNLVLKAIEKTATIK